MSLGNKIAWDDTVLPFQLDAADMRVGAAGHPHQQGLLNLETSQLGIEAIQNIRKDALRFGDGEPAGG